MYTPASAMSLSHTVMAFTHNESQLSSLLATLYQRQYLLEVVDMISLATRARQHLSEFMDNYSKTAPGSGLSTIFQRLCEAISFLDFARDMPPADKLSHVLGWYQWVESVALHYIGRFPLKSERPAEVSALLLLCEMSRHKVKLALNS